MYNRKPDYRSHLLPRVISDYRSRLASETVDGLICLQDWMRPSGGIDLTTIIEDLNNEDEMLNDTP